MDTYNLVNCVTKIKIWHTRIKSIWCKRFDRDRQAVAAAVREQVN